MNFDRVTLAGHNFSCNPLPRAITIDEFRTQFRKDVADDDIRRAYNAVSPYAFYNQYKELSDHMNSVAAEQAAASAASRKKKAGMTLDVRTPMLEKRLDEDADTETLDDVRRPKMS